MLKQLFHLVTEKQGDPGTQLLSLRTGTSHCSFAITSLDGNELFQLGYYAHDLISVNPVAEMFQQHPELNSDFNKVFASYDYPQSTLVPEQFFKQEEAPKLLKSLFGTNGNAAVVTEPVSTWHLQNIYAVPREMHEWMNKKFSAGNYWHQYTIGLKNIKGDHANGHLLVDIRSADFTVIAAKGNQLLLAQTFLYSTPEDVLYYLLKTCQEYELSQKQVLLSLSGLIEKNSVLYKELYQYFIHIDFRTARWNLGDSEYPAHFFTSLNDLAACGS